MKECGKTHYDCVRSNSALSRFSCISNDISNDRGTIWIEVLELNISDSQNHVQNISLYFSR